MRRAQTGEEGYLLIAVLFVMALLLFALATAALAGRRIIRVSMPRHTKEMKPIIFMSYRLRGTG